MVYEGERASSANRVPLLGLEPFCCVNAEMDTALGFIPPFIVRQSQEEGNGQR